MTMRSLCAAVALVVLSASAALAADMPNYAGPPLAPPDYSDTPCAAFNGQRQVDDVWRPGQVAYIVAARCGQSHHWLTRNKNILVYYNGESMDKTDIRVLRVPTYRRLLRH